MNKFFIIQSRDPYTDNRAKSDYELITHLANGENEVSVLFVQNGVMPIRQGSISIPFDKICNSNAQLFADAFSLRQREIEANELKQNVQQADVDLVIKAMLAGHKVIWH